MSRSRRSKTKRMQEKAALAPRVRQTPLAVWGCHGILLLAGLTAFANTFDGVFVYDDAKWVVALGPARAELSFIELLKRRRPLVDLSLAANYRHGKLDPRGYHAFNLAVHLLAALVLFGIIRRTLILPTTSRPSSESSSRDPPCLLGTKRVLTPHTFALAAALLWMVHPLQTQCVTYIIQRGESMMGMFYLLTLYCMIRGADGGSPGRTWIWYMSAVVACAGGMGCKAVMVTAPVVVLLYDRIFLAGSWSIVLRRRWGLHLGLAATWLITMGTGVVHGILQTRQPATIGFGTTGITWWEYALTQPGVILHYLRLSFWPAGQVIDYGWPLVRSASAAAGSIGLLSALLGAILLTLWRRPAIGFLGAWFFIILAPTSSIVPIKDPIYEHRMYLSLAGLAVLLVVVLDWLARRTRWRQTMAESLLAWLLILLTVVLGVVTHERNKVYQSALGMWEDVVAKRPDNARGHNNFGKYLLDLSKRTPSKLTDALEHLRTAVRLDDNLVSAHYNLGNALSQAGQYDESIQSYGNAITINSHFIEAHIMLGNAFTDSNRLAEAEIAFREGLNNVLAKTDRVTTARCHYNLGNTLFRLNRHQEAREEYILAVAQNSKHFKAQYGIGSVELHLRHYEASRDAFRAALKINPNHIESCYGLAESYKHLDQFHEALAAYKQSIKINPNQSIGWYRMGEIHEKFGEIDKAVTAYQRALKNDPNYISARRALQRILARRRGSS